MTPPERVWDDIHDLLPDRWRVGPPTYEPGRRRWSVTAGRRRTAGACVRRRASPGEGQEEIEAVTELANRLREIRDVVPRMALEGLLDRVRV